MARTKEQSFSLGMKMNLGNYQMAHFDVAETIELEPGDDPAKTYDDLRNRVAARLTAEATAWRSMKDAT